MWRELDIPGVLVSEPQMHRDERGYFCELWRAQALEPAGIPVRFVQANRSRSHRHVLRGLHFQSPNGQGKLIQVTQGAIFDVVVDVRVGSPHFGRWLGLELNEQAQQQLYIPSGFAHGFLTLSEQADVQYLCTDYYRPDCERGICWNDPQLAITWPIAGESPLLSPKDAALPCLSMLAPELLPKYSR